MKRIIALFALLTLLLPATLLSVRGLEHAEWDAHAWEDSNYDNFFGDDGGFIAELVMDGGLSTAWQKERGAMDQNGYFEKECFVALSWDDVMNIHSVDIWWRSSSRAEASPDGYVVQIGTGSGQNVTWSDVEANYAYNADQQDDGYFVCDTVTFAGEVETMHLRVLIKRGVDYVDPDRMYSPKVNELEVNADMSLNQPEETEPPVTSTEDDTSPEPPSPTPETGETTEPTTKPSSQPTTVPSPTAAASSSDDTASGQGMSDMLPWYILIGVSAAVVLISGIILFIGRKK